jgi:elongation factor P--beta-lysine ligase
MADKLFHILLLLLEPQILEAVEAVVDQYPQAQQALAAAVLSLSNT